ncbi:MAG TPA: hypothetical protein VEQ60_03355 [Longimicrobium sp.]|nr:hypothetical protein [Longimicrobium sp.]
MSTELLAPRALLMLLAAACTAACAPMVTHGPAVLGGTHVVLTGGAGGSPCDTVTCDLSLLPQGALGMHTGRAATGTRPGFQAGVNASINLISSELDLYVQAPTRYSRFDMGAGVVLGGTHVMPYVQAGRMRASDGSGFYTTQGFAWMYRRPVDYILSDSEPRGDDEPDELAPRYWAPSIAYRTGGNHGLHLYVSGAFGTAKAYAFPADGSPDMVRLESQPVRTLMAGVVIERSPRDLLRALVPFLNP